LRERRNDIPLLATHFLEQAERRGQGTMGISSEALSVMMDYPWPGNVRELQNAVYFALVKGKGRVIQPDDLPPEIRGGVPRRSGLGPPRKLEARSVRDALLQTGGNKARAARILGVGRATLYRFMAQADADVS
jgi:DNA-binding NtrC family response regulator